MARRIPLPILRLSPVSGARRPIFTVRWAVVADGDGLKVFQAKYPPTAASSTTTAAIAHSQCLLCGGGGSTRPAVEGPGAEIEAGAEFGAGDAEVSWG